jgi:hypothetical protein
MFQWRDIVPTYEVRLTKIKGIHLKNIEVEQASIAIDLTGEAKLPIEDIHLENITVHKVSIKARNIENVNGIVEKNVVLGE